jgi:tRNA(His) 5'-end guanylyltransferase
MDDLGDRMKSYENQEISRRFMSGLPIYARIDGRSFSQFTSTMNRPYDTRMVNCMIETTKVLVEDSNATIGYVQSDEISLVWIPNKNVHDWFNGKIMKMTSVLAGLASSAFCNQLIKEFSLDGVSLLGKLPHFDARVIVLPNEAEAANMLLWRNLDATKNAISMAAHHYYSHKELQNKKGNVKQEMLWQKGINFNDYPYYFKRGTWVRRISVERILSDEEIQKIPVAHRPKPNEPVVRSQIISYDLPPLNKISNRVDVLFRNTQPILLDNST